MTDVAEKRLVLDLDKACVRYLEIRIQFFTAKTTGEDISEINAVRTRAHDALIACFNPVLRLTKESDMVAAAVNRVEIGKWGMRRALGLLDGSKTLGDL